MTTLGSIETVCGNCRTASVQNVLTSTNAFGSPDLDGRPPPMKRHTMDTWLQECPKCRLVCDSIETPPPGAADVIVSPDYLAVVNNPSATDIIRKFQAWAHLAEALNLASDAAFTHLHIAWLADDADDAALAKEQRLVAAKRFRLLRDEGNLYPKQLGGAEALIADVSRRAGDFDTAIHEASRCISIATQDHLIKICELQTRLATQGDTAVHTMKEAKWPSRTHRD